MPGIEVLGAVEVLREVADLHEARPHGVQMGVRSDHQPIMQWVEIMVLDPPRYRQIRRCASSTTAPSYAISG